MTAQSLKQTRSIYGNWSAHNITMSLSNQTDDCNTKSKNYYI